MPQPQLEIRLLGPPEVRVDGSALEVDTRKAVALLAVLAIEPNVHQREALAALLWPDYERDSARAALRRTLSNLRKGLSDRWLLVTRETIGLDSADPHDVAIDVREFQGLVAGAEAHDHREAPCLECERDLRVACDLFRGPFMHGFSLRDSVDFEEWQLHQTLRVERVYGNALDRLADVYAENGKHDAAIAAGQQRLALDPLHEPAHRLLMRLFASTGRRTEAIRQFRECVAVLERELGVSPIEETSDLYKSIVENRYEERPRAIPTIQVPEPGARPLTGRADQLRALQQAYERLDGRPRFIGIEGEAGVGKSRCAEEFLRTVERRGARTLVARCFEHEADLAYAPIVEALRTALDRDDGSLRRLPTYNLDEVARLLPDEIPEAIPATSPEPAAHSRFLSGVSRVLIEACAGPTPGVLFVDDLHWADSASLSLLGWILRRSTESSLLILGAYRQEDAVALQRLRRVLGVSSAIHVGRLNEQEVMDLVEAARLNPEVDREKLALRLFEESEGLPLFLVEYLAALETQDSEPAGWDWPAGLRDVIRERVSGAGEISRQLLTAAAVVGRSFRFDFIREVSGRTAEEAVAAVEELVARGLIVEVTEGDIPTYDFSHDKIRALVYQDTGLARRRLLHSRAADALIRTEQVGSGEEWLWLSIANHCRLGGRDREAAGYYARAGDHAQRIFANFEAMSHFETALALGYQDPSHIHDALGDLHTLMGEYGAALTSYETAAALADDGAAVVEHKLGRVHHRRGDWDSAKSHYRAALALLAEGDVLMRSRILSDLSLTTHHAGDDASARDFGEQAVMLADNAGDDRALSQAHNVLGILAGTRDDVGDALHHLEKSRALARRGEDYAAEVAALNNLALTYRSTGQIEPALELTREGLRLCEIQGDRHHEAALHNNLADLLQACGEHEASMKHLKRAVALFAEIGEPGAMEPAIWKLVEW